MVSASEKRDSEEPYYRGRDEDGDAGLMRVRTALLSLPKATCPEGFEFRLQRRLRAVEGQPQATARSWTSGWLGVGLGFACAAVIALFVFDFNTSVPVAGPVTSTVQQGITTPIGGTSVDPAAPGGLQSEPGVTEPDRNVANSVDTMKRESDPARLPELMQVNDDAKPGN